MNKISLPFTIRHDLLLTHPGIQGLMVFDGEVLLLQYQTRHPITAAINSEIIERKIDLSDIEEVDFKKSIFGNTLTIRVLDGNSTKGIPNQRLGEITLSIERKHLELALDFVSSVRLEVADQKLRSME
jgi:hypothetical protein